MSHSLRRLVTVAGLATLALVATVTPALAAPSATTAARPSISSVTFSGQSGPGVASPTVTVRGSGFGTAPAGTSNAVTSCGTYAANGNVYGGSLYFTANKNFEAGYSDADGADCIGIIVVSWSSNRVVLKFGNSYGSFAHWYLDNGDGYALSLKTGLYGSKVRGLS